MNCLCEFVKCSLGSESEESIVPLVRHCPERGALFIKMVLSFSAASNLLVSSVVVYGLDTYLTDSSTASEQPLKWWLLSVAVIQLCQAISNRCVLSDIWVAEVAGKRFDHSISAFVASPAWCFSKALSFIAYCMLFGLPFVKKISDCLTCPLTRFVILSYLLRIVVVRIYLMMLFPKDEVGSSTADELKVQSASLEEISCLSVAYFDAETDDPNTLCAICMCEFTDKECMRVLPCGHRYHMHCCDAWLQRNKRCPLCVQPIDAN